MAKKKSAGKTKSGSSQSGPSPEMKRLEDVFRLMTAYGVGEVELEDDRGRLHARMPSIAGAAVSTTPSAVSPGLSPFALTPAAGSAKTTLSATQKKILSPFVGTFYRSATPNSAPYVSEGQSFRKNQTLCIIEAMKLMNQIESECEGKIVSILVENGQPVEFGEPLFVIE